MFIFQCKNPEPHAKHEHEVLWPGNRGTVTYICKGVAGVVTRKPIDFNDCTKSEFCNLGNGHAGKCNWLRNAQ